MRDDVDRVAKALCRHEANKHGIWFDDEALNKHIFNNWRTFVPQAEAAIAAITNHLTAQVTDAMVARAANAIWREDHYDPKLCSHAGDGVDGCAYCDPHDDQTPDDWPADKERAHRQARAAIEAAMLTTPSVQVSEAMIEAGRACAREHTDDEIDVAEIYLAMLTISPRETEGWQPIETAPHAMHFLAAYFDDCEWSYQIVMRPFAGPFTHWLPLPESPGSAPTRHEGKLVEALTEARAALEIFGRCPPFGKSGIELFVIAQAIYDGSKRSATPREAYWHWDDFVAVKNAIERIDATLASTAGPK